MKEIARNSVLHKIEEDEEIELPKGGYLVKGKLRIKVNRGSGINDPLLIYEAPTLLLPDENDYITIADDSILFQFSDDFFSHEFIMKMKKNKKSSENRMRDRKKSYAIYDFQKNDFQDILKKAENHGLVS